MNREGIVGLVTELVAIPTVSSDSAHAHDVRRSAELIAGLFADRGFAARVIEGDARPTVVATRDLAEARPTVLLYAHHDVQPGGSGWLTPPFEAVQRRGVVIGRGAGDDKAAIVAHLATVDALDRDIPARPVGLVVIIDGGEEVGSPGFDSVLGRIVDVDPDVVLVADGINAARGVPALTTSLRGLLSVDVTVTVMDAPAHSGINGGGVIDALTGLCRLIATLHDDDGAVAVSGLAPDGHFDGAQLDPDEFRDRLGVIDGVAVAGDLASRIWASASISVLGIDAPPVSRAANVLLPTARARLSVRIPPTSSPGSAWAALRDHLLAHAPFGAAVTSELITSSRPWSGDGGPVVVTDALAAAWSAGPVLLGGGGGIPVVSALAAAFPRAQIAVTAICDPESNVHGPDENVDLAAIERMIDAQTRIVRAFA